MHSECSHNVSGLQTSFARFAFRFDQTRQQNSNADLRIRTKIRGQCVPSRSYCRATRFCHKFILRLFHYRRGAGALTPGCSVPHRRDFYAGCTRDKRKSVSRDFVVQAVQGLCALLYFLWLDALRMDFCDFSICGVVRRQSPSHRR